MALVAAMPVGQQDLVTPPGPATPQGEDGDLFEVVGGSSSGGILVREGRDKSSAEAHERLATGALVRALCCEAGRMRYELLRGCGPKTGWVSLAAAGKALLAPVEMTCAENVDAFVKETGTSDEALKWYGQRLTEARKAGKGDFIYDRQSDAPASPKVVEKAANAEAAASAAELALQAAADQAVAASATKASRRSSGALARLLGSRGDVAEDSDGEQMMLCKHCGLPLGEYGYAEDGKDHDLMHGECIAQVMLQHRRKEEADRKQKQDEVKQSRREEYDIGWKASTIPSNVSSAEKLGCNVIPQGLCCLVLQEDDSVRLAPTFEPAGALNLEYLSVALRVRRAEGREPLFSLDPLEPGRREVAEASMQAKRFEPEWLAGTSVGEVMFQADYHLKELSMGEHEQPVVGMKSCFDYTKASDLENEWSAREWFVVRKAEMHLSEDAVLVPYLKMGVEAREQILSDGGALEDAPLTRPDHPLVRYAEAFTHNFDLIAERKSVVSQLREVAKASIVAKFLLEAGIQLGEQWYSLGSEVSLGCCLEVPQLWNDRCFSQIRVEEGGEIVSSERTREGRVHGVYGGVDFGIDRFRLAAPSRVATSVVAGRAALGRPASTLMATSQAGLSMAPGQRFTRLAAPLSARAALTAPSRLAPPLSARAGLAAPLSAMAAARPATSLMATSRASMAAPQARLAAPLRASMAAPSRLAAPLTARASLAAPLSAMAGARPATSLMATSRLSVGAPGRLAAPLSAMTAARPASSLMATSRISMAAPQTATARLSMGMPRGVDLSLEKFNLSAIAQEGSWAGTLEAPAGAEKLAVRAGAFFESLDGAQDGGLDAEARCLFKSVFRPALSDRREDGDLFVPPPTGLSYTHRLKMLVKQEEEVMQRRKEHFFSSDFAQDNAGSLFPSSWTSTIGLESGAAAAAARLLPRPDLLAEEGMLRDILATATPCFERATEDGAIFLIFKLGSLEVRATKERDGGELQAGAVFSMADAAPAAAGAAPREEERLAKVAEYVERAPTGAHRYYVLATTASGAALAVELLADGRAAWTADADAVAARTAQAKTLRSADVAAATVAELRAAAAAAARRTSPGATPSPSARKRFAQAIFQRLAGASER